MNPPIFNRVIDFIKSPTGVCIISIIGVVIAFAAWIFPFNGNEKDLDVAITQNVQLVPTQAFSKNNSLAFIYNGETVPNLISTKFRFRNSGKEPIEESDFIEGLNIIFPNDTRIIDSRLTQVQPAKNSSLFQQSFLEKESDNNLRFKPVLINPNEIFDIDIVTTRQGVGNDFLAYDPNQIQFGYRIRGISEINLSSTIETNFDKKEGARKTLIEISKPIVGGALVIFTLMIIGPLLQQLFAKKKKDTNIENRQKRTYVSLFIFWGVIILVLVYAIFSLIYNAFFLKI